MSNEYELLHKNIDIFYVILPALASTQRSFYCDNRRLIHMGAASGGFVK